MASSATEYRLRYKEDVILDVSVAHHEFLHYSDIQARILHKNGESVFLKGEYQQNWVGARNRHDIGFYHADRSGQRSGGPIIATIVHVADTEEVWMHQGGAATTLHVRKLATDSKVRLESEEGRSGIRVDFDQSRKEAPLLITVSSQQLSFARESSANTLRGMPNFEWAKHKHLGTVPAGVDALQVILLISALETERAMRDIMHIHFPHIGNHYHRSDFEESSFKEPKTDAEIEAFYERQHKSRDRQPKPFRNPEAEDLAFTEDHTEGLRRAVLEHHMFGHHGDG